MTQSPKEHHNHTVTEPESGVLAKQAIACILALFSEDEAGLTRESADFLQFIEALWQRHDIKPVEVWCELEARIDLSEELLQKGIRARKGGPYRSTKLP